MYGGTPSRHPRVLSGSGLSPRVRGNLGIQATARFVQRSIPACTGEPLAAPRARYIPTVYPRVYGGTIQGTAETVARSGLSPRVRGNRHRENSSYDLERSIPACTGEPWAEDGQRADPEVYPRVYGGTPLWGGLRVSQAGLSPRVRGNRIRGGLCGYGSRSIPACTGEPVEAWAASNPIRVYPRVYGGTAVKTIRIIGGTGLSPRVRGNPRAAYVALHLQRSIPACTGEPALSTGLGRAPTVYPRVYGGTSACPGSIRWGWGLSPRVRGNPVDDVDGTTDQRSIPACTGEPTQPKTKALRNGVYPRVYGGTYSPHAEELREGGLSPRVRGNHSGIVHGQSCPRSIPACTGEPVAVRRGYVPTGVYPRVYGGTHPPPDVHSIGPGLSPRVRGNRHHQGLRLAVYGSIPACTGEPSTPFARATRRQVYPRVYGGTADGSVVSETVNGLSPRVRGNLGDEPHKMLGVRSIPACTGEPSLRCFSHHMRWVYPRVYGGTLGLVLAADLEDGLSPRVRGNPTRLDSMGQDTRSIPACTGEPADRQRRYPLRGVYPRVYGGTYTRNPTRAKQNGLSPRVRGNLSVGDTQYQERRSIPACTGEPLLSEIFRGVKAVYPRVYGGTLGQRATNNSGEGLSPRVRGNLSRSGMSVKWRRSIPACTGEPDNTPRPSWLSTVYPRVYGGTSPRREGELKISGLSPRVRGNLFPCLPFAVLCGSIPACTGEPQQNWWGSSCI